MTTYFWADTHLGEDCKHVGTFREDIDGQVWDAMMLDAINSRVGKRDRLILVGDFGQRVRPGYWRQQIVCKNIMLVRGNHDAGQEKLERVFGKGNVRDMYWTKVCGVYTVISHYQQCFWDRSHHGSYHLHGHLHDNRSEWTEQVMPGHRSLDVGADSSFNIFGEWKPFTGDEIHGLLSVKPGHDKAEWYQQYQTERMKRYRESN